ncbi:16S rRNA (guanine(966)-N(2))-methyltransferase RsmD [bacterium]|nr:16S rRNA (guanine(966)-N(2))-methyltransferase RsmD [bacterium]MDY3021694.1 16S rRNA (guanine(966)-N(2))-methyltransferase RsmD [Oliverpabstia sp.]
MRVIAGKARSLRLKTIEGMDTRPTTDRIKETLFNMLQPYMADCRFLDLFAGSGAIGIEALSRGADCCVFVEQQRKAAECIRDNLKFTRLDGQARVMVMDAVSAIRKLDGGEPFQCIFMDPPYRKNLELDVLEALQGTSLIDEDTLIIVEASLNTTWEQVETMGYQIVKEKRYKTNQHLFLKKGGEL